MNDIILARPGPETITLARGGAAGVANINAVRLHKGIANRLVLKLLDDKRRALDVMCPDKYVKNPESGVEYEYELDALLMDPRRGEGVALCKTADFDALGADRSKGVAVVEFDVLETADLQPGLYNLAVRLRLVGTKEINGKDVKTLDSEELLVGGSAALPHTVVEVTDGILPRPYPSELVGFELEKAGLLDVGAGWDWRYVSQPVPAGADRRRLNSLHTFAVYMDAGYRGELHVEGSLEDFPDSDGRTGWFPLRPDGVAPPAWHIDYSGEHRLLEAFNITASVRKFRFWYTAARAREPGQGQPAALTGFIRKIVVRS